MLLPRGGAAPPRDRQVQCLRIQVIITFRNPLLPYVVNGIGTWQYGRKHQHARIGTCEFCHRYGPLQSYNTTLFLVVVMVPVIPLQRRRIIGHCPRCNKFRMMPQKKWEALRTEVVEPAAHAYLASPRDRSLAAKALAGALQLDDPDSFLAISESIEQSLPNDPEIQAMLGECYTWYTFPQQAEASYRRALAAKDDPKVRYRLAFELVRQKRTAEDRLLVTALGLRFPARRAEFFALARQFNAARTFPYWEIKDVLASSPNP